MATISYSREETASEKAQPMCDPGLRSVLMVAVRYTLITTLLLGIGYPLLITGMAQLTMRNKADGQLVTRNGQVIGSAILGQGFTGPMYFHSRPSAAGNGWDAANSGGSNLGPTSQALVSRVDGDVAAWHKMDPEAKGAVPIGLVTTSASGLDPDISPEGAYYQAPMIAAARHLPESTVRALVAAHIEGRQLGFLGEPRVNVLELNLALDEMGGGSKR